MRIEPCGKYKYVKRGLPREMPEHRYVMHTVEPRDDEDDLVVHHIDGNKSNNDPSNLMWMTPGEHSRLHHLGENHFPCDGTNNANYRHGMCVNGKKTKEYKSIHNHKSYIMHREERLNKQNAYGAMHREHKRLYDKIRYWEKELTLAVTDNRRDVCLNRLNSLREGNI